MGNNNIVPWSTHTAHNHIVSIVNLYLHKFEEDKSIRILDVGCGNGELLCQLLDFLIFSKPFVKLEVFGLDVFDSGVQNFGFMERTIDFLLERHPEREWKHNLLLVSTKEKWPFNNNSFDFILSNQVVEHVFDVDFFFNEIRRCLSKTGFSINLFPTREILWEGHINMPIVHKVRNQKLRSHIIYMLANFGFKKCYHLEMQRRGWRSIKEFSTVFSNVLETDTNYITIKQLISISRRNGLDISFRFTKDFFLTKLLSLFKRKNINYKDLGSIENLLCFFLKYLSCVTVILTKNLRINNNMAKD